MYKARSTKYISGLSTSDLIEVRKRFSLSQVQMAELLGLSLTQYARIEQGRWPILKIHALALETVVRNLDNAQRAFTGRPPV